MKCSNCNEMMEEGNAVVKATVPGIFVFGFSYKHLFFKGKNKGPNEKEIILKNNHITTAFKCNNCGCTTIIPNGKKGNLVHW